MVDSKVTVKIYMGILLVILGITFLLTIGGRLRIQNATDHGTYTVRTDLKADQVESTSYPIGIADRYILDSGWSMAESSHLVFFTKHSNVQVYADGECLYEMELDPAGTHGYSTGHVWNMISLYGYEGKQLDIIVIPLYRQVIGDNIVFYFGEESEIIDAITTAGAPSMILFAMISFLGLIFLITSPLFRNQKRNVAVALLGVFSLELGTWGVMEQNAFTILGVNPVPAAAFVFMLLASLPLSLLLCFRELLPDRNDRFTQIVSSFDMGCLGVVLLTQLMRILQFRQTLALTHLQIVVTIVCLIRMLFLEKRKHKDETFTKWVVVGILCCFVGALTDILAYYIEPDLPRVGTALGFLLFILFLGMSMLRQMQHLVDVGDKAVSFERIAFHDQLTGVMNRAAYAYDTGSPEFRKEGCIVVVFDLNNLKACNDKLGHDRGDVYISESARLIRETFGIYGSIYRMGGDEFCCLLHDVRLEKVRELVAELREESADWNRNSQDIVMQIACGYEMYDVRIDYDIADTSRRADKMMYQDKFDLKQKMKEENVAIENMVAAGLMAEEEPKHEET